MGNVKCRTLYLEEYISDTRTHERQKILDIIAKCCVKLKTLRNWAFWTPLECNCMCVVC